MSRLEMTPAAPSAAPFRCAVSAPSRPWRALAAAATALARTSLLAILALVLTADDPPVTPPLLAALTFSLVVLPEASARLVRRAFVATLEVGDAHVVVTRADERLEVRISAIAAVRPWLLPLPGPGLDLRLSGGGRHLLSLETPDVDAVLEALGARAGCVPAAAARATWAVAFARARAPYARRSLARSLLGHAAFALVPAAILFNAHQYIAFGGTFGEYHLLGPAAWLRTLGVYWLVTTIYLVLFAAVLRVPVEALALAAAVWRPRAELPVRVRRFAESAATAAYYLGVPTLLALRFLS